MTTSPWRSSPVKDLLDYFFNIPTHAPITYTLKSTKFTTKHFKNLKFVPTCFGPFLDHLQGEDRNM
jgi:hypothetical protein